MTSQEQDPSADDKQSPNNSSLSQQELDEWDTWRQSYVATTSSSSSSSASASENSDPTKTTRKDPPPSTKQQEETATKDDNDNGLEFARQRIIHNSKRGVFNDNENNDHKHCLSKLLNRLLREQQQEIMDRSVSKPWTIRRPPLIEKQQIQHSDENNNNNKTIAPNDNVDDDESSSSSASSTNQSTKLLRHIEWHVVLLLELWIHHGPRLIQQVYPQLLVLQHSRYEALRKEEKEKRKWKKLNKPKKMKSTKTISSKAKSKTKKAKHGKPKAALKPFSTTAYVVRQLGKWQTVMDRTPSLVSKLQTATPQDQEFQLLQHIANTISQAAFFLPANFSMTSFLTAKCLSPRIWKALPQVVTHVYDDLERSNPYLEKEDTDIAGGGVNILTTIKKKKKKKKKKSQKQSKQEEEPTKPPSRPKLVALKRNRLGHFHHRSRAAQSSMSKVLEHLSPVRTHKSSSQQIMLGSSKQKYKTPTTSRTNNTVAGKKSGQKRSRISSTLVTPHTNKAPKLGARKTPKLSLGSIGSISSTTPSSNAQASKKPVPVTNNKNTPSSNAPQVSKQPALVTTAKKKKENVFPKLQLVEPTAKSRSKPNEANGCENKAARRNSAIGTTTAESPTATTTTTTTTTTTAGVTTAMFLSPAKAKRQQRSMGLFPLSPIPTQLDSANRNNTATTTTTTTTPTRHKRPYEPFANPAIWKTPQREHSNDQSCFVAETPDASLVFPPPKQRVLVATSTPVRYNNNKEAVVAETPDTTTKTTAWKSSSSTPPQTNNASVAETPQKHITTTTTTTRVAETPQQLTTTTVAETPESANETCVTSNTWGEAHHHPADSEEGMEPMQLFHKPEPVKKKKKKPARRVYSLGGGKVVAKNNNNNDDTAAAEDPMEDRRFVTRAVLTQARAFIRRKSLLEEEEEE